MAQLHGAYSYLAAEAAAQLVFYCWPETGGWPPEQEKQHLFRTQQ